MRARLVLLFVLLVFAGAACNGGGADPQSIEDEPAAEEAPEQPQPAPEELAAQFSVPIPSGGAIESAEADPNSGEANFALTYQGPPNVDAYTQSMRREGWAVSSVEETGSFEIRAHHPTLVLDATVLYGSDQRIEWQIGPGSADPEGGQDEEPSEGEGGGAPADGGGFDY